MRNNEENHVYNMHIANEIWQLALAPSTARLGRSVGRLFVSSMVDRRISSLGLSLKSIALKRRTSQTSIQIYNRLLSLSLAYPQIRSCIRIYTPIRAHTHAH